MMVIQLGNNHTITIGHLTKMGSLNDVLAIGNSYRRNRRLKEITIEEYLRRNETWEFIQEVEAKYGKNTSWEFHSLEKDSKNRVIYSKYIKQFSVIKSQRGGKPENRGVWANLQIMLDLAIYLSPTLRLEMIDIFIESRILEWRDIGGDNYVLLNKAIDTLPDRIGKNNFVIHIEIAKLFREKLDLIDTKGYNAKEHTAMIQEKRATWEDRLIYSIEIGFITSFKQLKNIFKSIKVTSILTWSCSRPIGGSRMVLAL
ncbi:MAG TPA: DNA-binding protein [Thioploca sp.]|nr:DNA-binding protein [Thioploca sp.]